MQQCDARENSFPPCVHSLAVPSMKGQMISCCVKVQEGRLSNLSSFWFEVSR